jgi:hypothetical protein
MVPKRLPRQQRQRDQRQRNANAAQRSEPGEAKITP